MWQHTSQGPSATHVTRRGCGGCSVERMVDYVKQNEPEAPAVVYTSRPPGGWPTEGEIQVQELVVRYRPDLPDVLKGLTFHISARHKVTALVLRAWSFDLALSLRQIRMRCCIMPFLVLAARLERIRESSQLSARAAFMFSPSSVLPPSSCLCCSILQI